MELTVAGRVLTGTEAEPLGLVTRRRKDEVAHPIHHLEHGDPHAELPQDSRRLQAAP